MNKSTPLVNGVCLLRWRNLCLVIGQHHEITAPDADGLLGLGHLQASGRTERKAQDEAEENETQIVEFHDGPPKPIPIPSSILPQNMRPRIKRNPVMPALWKAGSLPQEQIIHDTNGIMSALCHKVTLAP